MKNITHLPTPFRAGQDDLTDLDLIFDMQAKQQLKPSEWAILQRLPETSFVLFYDQVSLYIKFFVSEPYFKADYRHLQDPVSEDSCVELFIAFGTDSNYYNLEFNALGTCLAAYGNNRFNRQPLAAVDVKGIRHLLTWKEYLPAEFSYQWTLTLEIPIAVFSFSELGDLTGTSARANVYKCGDKLPEPHYLMWNNIETAEPDYHQPGFFLPVAFSKS